jgi:hypothetical protein
MPGLLATGARVLLPAWAVLLAVSDRAAGDPLSSWKNGPAKAAILAFVSAAALVLASPAIAQTVDAGTALRTLGFPPDAQERALSGQFVESALPTASERDLAIGMTFFVGTAPETLASDLYEKRVLQRADPQAIAWGILEGDGSAAQLENLKLTPRQLDAYAAAAPGETLNLSSREIAALRAAGQDGAALRHAVCELLLARYRAYRASGLAGIAPYARDGSQTDPASELAAMNRVVRASQLLPASFYSLLSDYPKRAPTDLVQAFYWNQFTAHGEDTLALVHAFEGTFGGTLVAVQRQYYVSTGFNAVQEIAGLLPAPGGTLVIYTNHTSTDQLRGFGAGAKRGIGRSIMAGELQRLFRAAAVTR